MIDTLDQNMEDVLWVRFEHKVTSQVFFAAVCYLPPVGSGRDVDIEELFQILCEQMQKFQAEGQIIVCGDFNARCGGLQDVDDANGVLHGRISIDPVANEQGELLAECLQSSGFCFVNGQKGSDDFTCISAKGASVVGYCIYYIVPVKELDYVTNFSIITM